MNLIKTGTPFVVEAKSSGSQEKENKGITYHFIESPHTLCLDIVELLKGQINLCKRLLREIPEHEEKEIIKNKIMSPNKALAVVK
jgi:hypothetical protein